MKIMKSLNKIYLFIVLLVASVFVLILSSCKSSKSGCDAYGSLQNKDSLVVKVEHFHIDEENYCFYSVDTIHINK